MSTNLDSSATDYSQKAATHGSYKVSRIIPLTGQEVPLSSSSTHTEITFPDRVYNYKPSTVDWTLTVPGTSANYTRLHTLGLAMVERVHFYGSGTVSPIDQPGTDIFTRCVWGMKTRLKDFLTYESTLGSALALNADQRDSGFNMFRSNDRNSIFYQQVVFTSDGDLQETFKVNPSPVLKPNSVRIAGNGLAGPASLAYTEFNYFKQSGQSSDIICNFRIPLAKLAPHSIFDSPRDVVYGQQMTLKLFFKPLENIGWLGTSLIDISAGAANIATVCTLTNLRVSLAINTDETINTGLRNILRTSGFKYVIPQVKMELLVNAPSSSINHLIKINRGNGMNLLNIYSCVANGLTAGRFSLDVSNTGLAADKKILKLQESINGSTLTEYVLDCTKKDDWAEMKDLLEDSCIQNSNIYDHNRMFCRSFRAGKCVEWDGESDVVLDGKSLMGEEINYAIQYTLNATPKTYRSYMFVVTQRHLTVLNNGLMTIT